MNTDKILKLFREFRWSFVMILGSLITGLCGLSMWYYNVGGIWNIVLGVLGVLTISCYVNVKKELFYPENEVTII